MQNLLSAFQLAGIQGFIWPVTGGRLLLTHACSPPSIVRIGAMPYSGD